MGVDRLLLLATRNAGKLDELNGLFRGFALATIGLDAAGLPYHDDEENIEAFGTLRENAIAKAGHFHRLSGLPTIADDSGLAVDILNGAPGVHSRRYSGRDDLSGQDLDDANNRKLLLALCDTLHPAASFVCAGAYVGDGFEWVEEGIARGEILRAPRGENGFGYDPYFLSSDLAKTFGEAAAEEKSLVSHRGRAFSALVALLRERGRIR
ncbi:MAG: non-canonical purine NTP pyrophosphatase [Gemmatimonadaceae bacterium]